MKIIKVHNMDVIDRDTNCPDMDMPRLSDVPKGMAVPIRCPECHRPIYGNLEDYGKGITCIDCNCSFKFVYDFPLHE